MTTSLIAMALTLFTAVALTSYAVLDAVFADEKRVARRLKDLTEYEQGQARQAQPLLRPFRERALGPFSEWLGGLTRRLMPTQYRQDVAAKLETAGHPRGMDVGRFLAAKLTLAVGAFLVSTMGLLLFGKSLSISLLAALVVGLLGYFAPDLWLSSTIESRRKQIVRELPDMLDMLTISVEAGLGFDAALSKLVRNTTGPLAEEFGRMLQEVQAGSTRKEALRRMAQRVDVAELSSFTASIIQAEMFGISISKVLQTQAGEMRLRRRQRAEEEAQKAPVKMVIPLVVCILPATLIVVAGPAIIRAAVLFK